MISACNDTLLTPITTIKTLLPLGPFQVLINQMAAKRPSTHPSPHPTPHPPCTHTNARTHSLTGWHPHTPYSPALTEPCGLAKKHIWRNKTSPRWQTNASTLRVKGEPLSSSLACTHPLSPSACVCDVGIMNATSPLGTVPYWEGLESCPVCSSLIA